MPDYSPHEGWLPPKTRDFYLKTFEALTEENHRFLVGGAYALCAHTGIARHTKDLDLFVKPEDCPRVLACLAAKGFRTEMTDSVWLGKCFCGEDFIDIVFRSGNGMAAVDDEWFQHALQTELLSKPILMCAPEEMIWSKAFTMERERYDGADIAHLLLSCADSIDWQRLCTRFGDHWRVLLSYFILFGFIYPSERHRIPASVLESLLEKLRNEAVAPAPRERVCRGTLLSRLQFLPDVEFWKFQDARFLELTSLDAPTLEAWKEQVKRQKEIRSIEVA